MVVITVLMGVIQVNKERTMPLRPGENTEKDGGIYREVGPRGGKTDNYATIADNKSAPPTTKSGNRWEKVKRTPNSKR